MRRQPTQRLAWIWRLNAAFRTKDSGSFLLKQWAQGKGCRHTAAKKCLPSDMSKNRRRSASTYSFFARQSRIKTKEEAFICTSAAEIKRKEKTFWQSFADYGHGLARNGRAACRFLRNLNVNRSNEPFCAADGVPFESDCAAKEKRFSSFTKNFQFSYLIFPAQVIRIYISTQS